MNLVRRLRSLMSVGFLRCLLFFSKTEIHAGIELATLFGDEQAASRFKSLVRGALIEIGKAAPHRLSRMQTDLKRIIMFPIGAAAGQYVHSLKACILNPDFVLSDDTNPLRVAIVLVHEATHARLCRAGLDCYDGAPNRRLERLCSKAEISFARRVPGLEEYADRLEDQWHEEYLQ